MGKKAEQPPAVVLGDSELARREGGRTWVRSTPVRLRFELDELFTADNHRLRVGFGCCVAARPEAAERQMLEEAFLAGKATCSACDVVAQFMPAVVEAGRRVVGRKPAEGWLSESAKPELIEALRKAADAAGFAAGVEVLPPYRVDVESPSLQRVERERAAREQAEREQADRLAHLRRSAEVLKEFEGLRRESPSLSVGGLLARLTGADQGQVVRSLIEARGAEGRGKATLYAVAGPHLIRVGEEAEEVGVGGADLGPYRSVQVVEVEGRTHLAIGARCGVVRVDPGDPAKARNYAATEITSPMGFNRVGVWGGRLWASHSDAGLVAWDLATPGRPAVWVRRGEIAGDVAEGPKNLLPVGERLMFSVGGRVLSMDRSRVVELVSEGLEAVVALVRVGEDVIAVWASGEVGVVAGATRGRERRSSRVTAAALLPFYDSARVLLATEDGPVVCVSVEDPVVIQYPSPHRGLRALAGSEGQVAGVSGDRQRVVVFATDGTRPPAEVHVGVRFKHRVADLTYAR